MPETLETLDTAGLGFVANDLDLKLDQIHAMDAETSNDPLLQDGSVMPDEVEARLVHLGGIPVSHVSSTKEVIGKHELPRSLWLNATVS